MKKIQIRFDALTLAGIVVVLIALFAGCTYLLVRVTVEWSRSASEKQFYTLINDLLHDVVRYKETKSPTLGYGAWMDPSSDIKEYVDEATKDSQVKLRKTNLPIQDGEYGAAFSEPDMFDMTTTTYKAEDFQKRWDALIEAREALEERLTEGMYGKGLDKGKDKGKEKAKKEKPRMFDRFIKWLARPADFATTRELLAKEIGDVALLL
jgi:hypothetical protein